jgi:hypothetical protein
MLTAKAAAILDATWNDVSRLAQGPGLKDSVADSRLLEDIRLSVNSAIKTYRYVLPTQVVAKLADSSLDCTCVQALRGGKGAFDARTIAHAVIVPFDQSNESVLGGSSEPYVNNPLRIPEISAEYRDAQKDKTAWDRLCRVLAVVERTQQPRFTNQVFRQILTEIYRRLAQVRVTYPTPRRASLSSALQAMSDYLVGYSGGDRLLALTSALFVVIGKRFNLFPQVRRAKITAADAPSGMLADLECVSKNGDIFFAVEVKDRQLTISQVKAKMKTIRERKVSEIFFVARDTVPDEKKKLNDFVEHQFTSGHNVYITDLLTLSRTALAVIGEEGRRDFLQEIAEQLEKYKSEVAHRRAWAELLGKI